MIKIVDYGLGNVLAFQNVYKRLNIPAAIAREAADLEADDRIILPGVGAFDHAMQLLQASGMRERLDDLVLNRGTPVLGVCVGMQILAASSEEGAASGLGWIEGRVRSLRSLEVPGLLLPHMGWNDVEPVDGARLFRGLEKEARFYFLHSFFFECTNAADVAARSVYGAEFACSIARSNIYGAQFHPEKSHHFGARLLQNFAEL